MIKHGPGGGAGRIRLGVRRRRWSRASSSRRSARARCSARWRSSPTRRAPRRWWPRPISRSGDSSAVRASTCLLDHERGIARSIERALSHRLAAMNHGDRRAPGAFSHRLACGGVRPSQPPGGQPLIAGVAARPGWDPRCCAGRAPAPATKARWPSSSSSPRLLRARGVRTSSSIRPCSASPAPTFREPDPAWLRRGSRGDGGGRRTSSRPPTSRCRGGRGRGRREARSRRPRGPHFSRPRPPGTSTAGLRRSVGERVADSAPGSATLRTRLSGAAGGPGAGGRPAAASARCRSSVGSPGSFTTMRALSAIARSRRSSDWGGSCHLPDGLGRQRSRSRSPPSSRPSRCSIADVLPDYVVMLFLDSGPCPARPRCRPRTSSAASPRPPG